MAKEQPKEMDVIASMRKIAMELAGIGLDLRVPVDVVQLTDGAAFMIKYIAEGLEREFSHAAKRAYEIVNNLPELKAGE